MPKVVNRRTMNVPIALKSLKCAKKTRRLTNKYLHFSDDVCLHRPASSSSGAVWARREWCFSATLIIHSAPGKKDPGQIFCFESKVGMVEDHFKTCHTLVSLKLSIFFDRRNLVKVRIQNQSKTKKRQTWFVDGLMGVFFSPMAERSWVDVYLFLAIEMLNLWMIKEWINIMPDVLSRYLFNVDQKWWTS